MPRVLLTDRFAAAAKALDDARTDYFDQIVSGLGLRVTPNGHRSWSFCFTSPSDGKWKRLTLGSYPATSLAAARGKALEAKSHIEAGQDPRTMADPATINMTVRELVEHYLADPEKAVLRSRASIERRLRRNVLPIVGDVKISDLRRRDIRNVTEPLLRRNVPGEAILVFTDIRAAVRWAVQHEYLEHNPLEGMKKPAVIAARNRVLVESEIHALWNSLPVALAKSTQCQRIIKLCLITAQRVGEISGMRRAELDLAAREWRLPGSRTKNAHAHVVPLSDLAIDVIREALGDSGNECVFPRGSGSLPAAAVAKEIFNTNDHFGIPSWSAHDLRRTALTEMARLGVAPIVLGHVANHRSTTRAGVTLAVYSQYTYAKEKAAALDLWADRLAAIVGGNVATITPMQRGQK
jgi:integrase